jgi:hypothetical protein
MKKLPENNEKDGQEKEKKRQFVLFLSKLPKLNEIKLREHNLQMEHYRLLHLLFCFRTP